MRAGSPTSPGTGSRRRLVSPRGTRRRFGRARAGARRLTPSASRLPAGELRLELLDQLGDPLADVTLASLPGDLLSEVGGRAGKLGGGVRKDLFQAVVGLEVAELLVGRSLRGAGGGRLAGGSLGALARRSAIALGALVGELALDRGQPRINPRRRPYRSRARAEVAAPSCRTRAYASWTSSNRRADSGEPPLWSGWCSCTRRRYAARSSASEAPRLTPRVAYGSELTAIPAIA